MPHERDPLSPPSNGVHEFMPLSRCDQNTTSCAVPRSSSPCPAQPACPTIPTSFRLVASGPVDFLALFQKHLRPGNPSRFPPPGIRRARLGKRNGGPNTARIAISSPIATNPRLYFLDPSCARPHRIASTERDQLFDAKTPWRTNQRCSSWAALGILAASSPTTSTRTTSPPRCASSTRSSRSWRGLRPSLRRHAPGPSLCRPMPAESVCRAPFSTFLCLVRTIVRWC